MGYDADEENNKGKMETKSKEKRGGTGGEGQPDCPKRPRADGVVRLVVVSLALHVGGAYARGRFGTETEDGERSDGCSMQMTPSCVRAARGKMQLHRLLFASTRRDFSFFAGV